MRILAIALGLLLTAGAGAQVYTWEDEHGNTHYGDRPPTEQPAETLDIDATGLSTVGESGLRPSEQDALERIRAEEAAAAERRLQNRALALEQQRIDNERAMAEVALEESREPVVRYENVISYPPTSFYDDRYRHGFSFRYHHGEKYDRWGRHRPRPEHYGRDRDRHHYPGYRPRPPTSSISPQSPRGLTRSGGRLGVTAGGPPGN